MPVITTAADRRVLDEGRQTRAMSWIMGIMLFLTVLAAATGLGTLRAAAALDRQLEGRLTVQIVEADAPARARDTVRVLAMLRARRDVARAEPVDHAQLAALLKPWLGEDGADPDLPVPAMIDVDLRAGDAPTGAIEQAVQRLVPAAQVDRHARWMSPVSSFMGIVTWLALALVVLMAGATAAVVILAARAGLEAHSDTIEVMHMLGSTDVQVARLFQRRIALDTLVGGTIGTAIALGVVGFIGVRLATLGSDLLNGIALANRDWLVLVALPLAFALLATIAARSAVLGALRRIL